MDLCYEAEEILLGYEARRIEDDIDTYLAICSSKYGETEFTGLEGYNLGCITGRTEIYTQDIKTWSAGLEKAEGNIFQRTIAWIKKVFSNFWNWLKGIFGGDNKDPSKKDPSKAKPNKMMVAIKKRATTVASQLKACKEKNIAVKADLTGLWTIDMFKACNKLDEWSKEDSAATEKLFPEITKIQDKISEIRTKAVTSNDEEALNKELKELNKQHNAISAQLDDTTMSKFWKSVKDASKAAKLLGVSNPTYKGEITIDDNFVKFFEELDAVFPVELLTECVKVVQFCMANSKNLEAEVNRNNASEVYKKLPLLSKIDLNMAKSVTTAGRANLQAVIFILRKLMALVSKVSAAANKALGVEKKEDTPTKEADVSAKGVSDSKSKKNKKKKKGKGGKESYMPTFRSTRLKRLGGTA